MNSEIDVELVPQGTFAERIRAAGAGIGGFFTSTAYGTHAAEGKEMPSEKTEVGLFIVLSPRFALSIAPTTTE